MYCRWLVFAGQSNRTDRRDRKCLKNGLEYFQLVGSLCFSGILYSCGKILQYGDQKSRSFSCYLLLMFVLLVAVGKKKLN